jgi:hypothetical protein
MRYILRPPFFIKITEHNRKLYLNNKTFHKYDKLIKIQTEMFGLSVNLVPVSVLPSATQQIQSRCPLVEFDVRD